MRTLNCIRAERDREKKRDRESERERVKERETHTHTHTRRLYSNNSSALRASSFFKSKDIVTGSNLSVLSNANLSGHKTTA